MKDPCLKFLFAKSYSFPGLSIQGQSKPLIPFPHPVHPTGWSPVVMNLFQRIFSHPLRFSASQGADHIAAQDKLPMAQIQQALRDALHDCADVRGQRVSYNIDQAKTPVELWALRSDLHSALHKPTASALQRRASTTWRPCLKAGYLPVNSPEYSLAFVTRQSNSSLVQVTSSTPASGQFGNGLKGFHAP